MTLSSFFRLKPVAIWGRVLLMLFSYFITILIVSAVGYLIIDLLYPSLSDNTQVGIMCLLTALCTILLVVLFVRYFDQIPFKAVGFQLKNHTRGIWLGLATGAVLMALGFFSLWLLSEITIDSIYFNLHYLLISTCMFVFVAIEEEVVFRGYILRNLMSVHNKYVSLILSSLLFALLHGLNPNFSWFVLLQITLAGMLLGITYYHTKNLWFPVSLHFSWNFFQGTIFGFNVSGIEIYTLIVQRPVENNLLNGGAFGYEGSVFCTITLLVAITIIEIYFRRRKKVGEVDENR